MLIKKAVPDRLMCAL